MALRGRSATSVAATPTTAVLLLLLLIAAATAGRAAASSWSKCDNEVTYPLDPTNVSISPDHPSRGHQLTIKIDAIANQVVPGGTFELKVYWGWLRIFDVTQDLCQALADGYSCPIADGDVKFAYVSNLPKNTPRARLKAKMRVHSSDGGELACLEMSFKVSRAEAEYSAQ